MELVYTPHQEIFNPAYFKHSLVSAEAINLLIALEIQPTCGTLAA
jgi:hypothetical protein